jgi:hypothetical protein
MSLPKFTAEESLYNSDTSYRVRYLSDINVQFNVKVLPQLARQFFSMVCGDNYCVSDGGGFGGERQEFTTADGTRIIVNPSEQEENSLDIPSDIKERGGGGGELPPIERDENNMPKNPKLDVQIDRLENQLDRLESQHDRLESQGRIRSRRDE